MRQLVIDHKRPPFFVGAGVIRSEEQSLYYAGEPMLAAQVIGSFSENEWGGTDPSGEKAVFYWDEANQAAYNAIGLRNPGRKAASEYLPRTIKAVHDTGQVAIIGVTALGHEDPVKAIPDLVEWALEMGADGVEINGSCPNEQYHILLCESFEMTSEVVDRSRERVGGDAYIMVKMSALKSETISRYKRAPLWANGVDVINNCRRISPVNTLTTKPFIEVNDGYAGQSGPIIGVLARENLRSWREASDFDVWSIGGIDNGYEAYDRVHNLGAMMVGGAQAFYRSDTPRAEIRRWAKEYAAAANAV